MSIHLQNSKENVRTSKHIKYLIQIIIVGPYKHTNPMTSTTYGGVYFLAGLLDRSPVNISVSMERMLAGGWSRGLAGKWPPLLRITYESMEVISVSSLDKWPDNTERKSDYALASLQ